MQVQIDVVFASLTNRTFRHTDFALGDVDACLHQRISQIARSDRTEQLAFITGLGDQRQLNLGQLGSTRSEERRVGKEGRARGETGDEDKEERMKKLEDGEGA